MRFDGGDVHQKILTNLKFYYSLHTNIKLYTDDTFHVLCNSSYNFNIDNAISSDQLKELIAIKHKDLISLIKLQL